MLRLARVSRSRLQSHRHHSGAHAFMVPNGCSTVSRRWRIACGFASRAAARPRADAHAPIAESPRPQRGALGPFGGHFSAIRRSFEKQPVYMDA
jgi:hypothetical protein